MIVKDEAPVMERCLGALQPYIDHALIIDTGSTDNTKEVIKEVMPDAVIGESEFTGENFSFRNNRTELLEKAREVFPDADYHLMIDADDTWTPSPGWDWPEEMTEDAYMVKLRLGGIEYERPQVFRASKPFRYTGAAHEALHCDEGFTLGKLEGVRIQCGSDGARRRKEPIKKYERVAAQLQADHEENPTNRRTVFYLAQSYRDCLKREKALKYYELRVQMGGHFREETWYAMYQVARLKEILGFKTEEILASYVDAYNFRPTRSEPLVSAAMLCRRMQRRGEQLMFSATAIHIPRPPRDRLFIEWQVYDWRAWDEFAMACWHQRRYRDALWANWRILCQSDSLEGHPEERIIKNIVSCSQPQDEHREDLELIWKAFRKLPWAERTEPSLTALFQEHFGAANQYYDNILLAITTGGGFPQ
jgi:tetratricopeptide (TPR) repeat protein